MDAECHRSGSPSAFVVTQLLLFPILQSGDNPKNGIYCSSMCYCVILSNEQIEGGPDTEAMFILCEFLAAVDYFVYRDLKTRLVTNVRILLITHVKGFIIILIF